MSRKTDYSVHLSQASSRAEVLAGVARKGRELANVRAEFQDDKEIVLAAVKQDGVAIASASPRLRDDYEVAKKACKYSSYAFSFVGSRLRNNRELRKYSRVDASQNESWLSKKIGRTMLPEVADAAAMCLLSALVVTTVAPVLLIQDKILDRKSS